MTILNDTAPKRIWLCVSDEQEDHDMPYPELYAEDAEITWSTDQPVAVTVEYVRVDLSDIAKLRAERDALQLSVAGFDAAREMLNVQDNKIDKLLSALQIARETIYSLDAREIYDDELALIDAALAEGRS